LHAALAISPRLPELVDVGLMPATTAAPRASPYLALRWIEGQALSELDERAALHAASAIAADIGEALPDLHAVGPPHGDCKTENVLLDPEGRAHLIDLGLACNVHATEIAGGTLRYLARSDGDLGDARARDLIALGAMLAELVDPSVRRAETPIAAAREARLPRP